MTATPSSRHPNNQQQDTWAVDWQFPQVTTTQAAVQIFKSPPGRAFKIDRAYIVDPAGLAASGSAYVAVTIVNSNTGGNACTWSTQTGQQGTLPAGTLEPMTLSATPADLVVPAGATLSLVFTVTSTPTLPAGAIRVEGRLL